MRALAGRLVFLAFAVILVATAGGATLSAIEALDHEPMGPGVLALAAAGLFDVLDLSVAVACIALAHRF